ncbi:MAG: hypothetical protein CMG59_02470 [Candidatus Marinimicrobia bacterium]|nr:hypothetical protein [Candidatus Neomarinimicrobiota bacterium]|tara:strand:+ start:439 stop:1026 length:588 start_codon:yes stop_codon:yes gene_type:complete
MESKIKYCIFITCLLLFQSCGFYSFKGSIPAHIDSLYISPILNNSKEYLVLDVFNDEIYDTFLKENVLKLEDINDAKSRLDIVILSVTDKPFSYSINDVSSFYEQVNEWRITIKTRVEWIDLTNNEPLLSKEMTSFGIYSPTLNNDISNDGIDNDQDGLLDNEDEDEFGLPRDSALIIASRKTAENIISAITSTW